MAIITPTSKFILPEVYFGVSHGHIADLKLESGTVSAQISPWSRQETNVKVTEYKPHENKVKLSNGKEFTYKSLVITPGLDHKVEYIEGLPDFENDRGENQTYVHALDNKYRIDRNYYHGWSHHNGDMICYSPKFPYKGEGSDFYALYYEHILR